MGKEQKPSEAGRFYKQQKDSTGLENWTTSSKPPEGYEICPHCEGDKVVFLEGVASFRRMCKLCDGTGMIDWVTKAIHKDPSKREYPLSHFEQIKKRDEFRKRMKERIKNDKSKSKR